MFYFNLDYPKNFELSFQDPASITAEGLINLHHDIMFYLIFIIIFVICFLNETLFFFFTKSYNNNNNLNKWFKKSIFANSKINIKQIDKQTLNICFSQNQYFITYIFLILCFTFIFIFSLVYFIIFLILLISILYLLSSKEIHNFLKLIYYIFYLSIVLMLKYNFEKFKSYSSFNTLYNINKDNINHHSNLEIIWTLIPTAILCLIALPSIRLLYAVDEAIFCPLTIKIIGHQWYWSYEYGKLDIKFENNLISKNISFDSYMIPYDDLQKGHIRLLSCDNALVLPIWLNIRLLVTSEDVLHSWAVPSLGVKIDAVPGRLNQNFIYIKRPGMFFGQCSEICGTNHGFMPINVNACYPDSYVYWYMHVICGSSQISYNNNSNFLK